jgi:hypothetical protein
MRIGAITAILLGSLSASLSAEPTAAQPSGGIGYPSVQAALEALRAKQGVIFSTAKGWTVAKDDAEPAVWLFAPSGDPAYPTAVKRHISNDADGSHAVTDIHCEVARAACDELARQLEGATGPPR